MPHSSLFFTESALDESTAERLVQQALSGADDGELFLEYNQSESLHFDDRKLKNASLNVAQGFGLRSVIGEMSAFAHSTDISEQALRRASETITSIQHQGAAAEIKLPAPGKAHQLYNGDNPISAIPFEKKIALLQEIDSYLRTKDNRVVQVSASLSGQWQVVHIIRADGRKASDVRPLVRIGVNVIVEQDGRRESGNAGAGGRAAYTQYISGPAWKKLADEALRTALVNLESIPAPGGEMTVVLGAGWPGILLHEAIGHGLEGDFNRKGTSAFAGLMGKQIASLGVTVKDDGTIEGRRGSLNVDDEGTPTHCTTLIEDGILVGYLQDRQNARLMNAAPTGNGRRESFGHQPMPRMTNTYMLSGDSSQESMIASVKKGVYAANFGGGQVDITSGKFVFSASEAYLIENGKITRPIKGATIIGNGPDCLTKIRAIGNDMRLDDGIGTCGKAGQSVPVGVGQPSLLIEGLTVGGTAV
ncbi:MAG: metalloprotease TldD [Alphaproteobacteria bacterium]|nr:metalloprotease TldD [Alphaproteobacteria bacterium]